MICPPVSEIKIEKISTHSYAYDLLLMNKFVAFPSKSFTETIWFLFDELFEFTRKYLFYQAVQ